VRDDVGVVRVLRLALDRAEGHGQSLVDGAQFDAHPAAVSEQPGVARWEMALQIVEQQEPLLVVVEPAAEGEEPVGAYAGRERQQVGRKAPYVRE
jgi:hypothetical protein